MSIPYTTEQDVLTVASLVKPDRETRSVIPLRNDAFSPDESGWNVDGNQIDPALQAKVDRTLALLGENKGTIIQEVWGETPGKGEGYKRAVAEYTQVIALMARREA